jgi:hypothetical protein
VAQARKMQQLVQSGYAHWVVSYLWHCCLPESHVISQLWVVVMPELLTQQVGLVRSDVDVDLHTQTAYLRGISQNAV